MILYEKINYGEWRRMLYSDLKIKEEIFDNINYFI